MVHCARNLRSDTRAHTCTALYHILYCTVQLQQKC